MKVNGMEAIVQRTLDTKSASHSMEENKHKTDFIIENKRVANISEFEKNSLPTCEKVVIEAIEKANKAISSVRRFEFSIHEKTKEIMVKVIDNDTNEVIREIPPEKVLDMVAKMWEMAGIIVDERR